MHKLTKAEIMREVKDYIYITLGLISYSLDVYKRQAYVEARYNRLFTVSKEHYEYMLAQTEVLHEVTIRECAARMAYYLSLIHI